MPRYDVGETSEALLFIGNRAPAQCGHCEVFTKYLTMYL